MLHGREEAVFADAGYTGADKKLRYRGLAKNTAQLHILFALANLVIVKKTLLAQSRGLDDPGFCLDPGTA